jgi:hypothetical protein
MKTTNVLKTVASILILAVTTSCSKSKDAPSPNTPDSRTVKYEITGNAVGTSYDATFITASGSGGNEIPTALPWSKEVVMQAGNNSVALNAAVLGASPGKTITAKIYVGGVLKKEETATVQANGGAYIGALSYTLK